MIVASRNAIAETNEQTRLYRPDDFTGITQDKQDQPLRTVMAASSLEAAGQYITSGKTAVLNFASAKNPGGGFLGGSQAQEESLARSSALYGSLMTAWDYYEINRKSPNALYTDHIIYSPDVVVFRNDAGDLLDDPWTVSFIIR